MERCANHPRREAVTRCASCRRRLCGECWLHDVADEPWCERCIFYLTSSGGNLALAVAFFLTVVTVGWAGIHWEILPNRVWWWTIAGAIPVAIVIARREPPKLDLDVKRRRPEEVPPTPQQGARRGHPYRALVRRASRVVASPVSGTKTAAVLALSMALVGLTVPQVLHLPRVAELELVLLGWWLLWGITGTVLLVRGFRVADDHVLGKPRPPWFMGGRTTWEKQERLDKSCLGCSFGVPILPFVILVLAFSAAWLMVEVVLPVLFFLVYFSVRAGLAAVANDEHDCAGRLPRALAWGFIWSTVFAFPLAGTLAMVRLLGLA